MRSTGHLFNSVRQRLHLSLCLVLVGVSGSGFAGEPRAQDFARKPSKHSLSAVATDAVGLEQGREADDGAEQARIVFSSSFEDGKIYDQKRMVDGWKLHSGKIDGATVVKKAPDGIASHAREGDHYVQFHLDRRNWDGTPGFQQADRSHTSKPRAQLNKPRKVLRLEQGVEYWMGVSTFLPDHWVDDKQPLQYCVLWQFHGTGGATGRSPPLVLNTAGDGYVILSRSGNKNDTLSYQNVAVYQEKGLHRGRWIDWVVNAKFVQTGEDGFIRIWRDGKQIVNRRNVNTLYYTDRPNPDDGVAMLLSLYKGKIVTHPSDVVSANVAYDAFRFAQGSDAYDLVNPGSYSANPLPTASTP
ncbi:MAG: heparin lyase I family protein [Halioglobus sp.]|nr:heparin lyase I family protein [Halioglobus sp.]